MKQTRVQAVPKQRAAVYLKRSQNLLRTMELAANEANPDGVATSAVQAAVALGDAYTIHFRQERCRGQDHQQVIALIARCAAPRKGDIGPLLSRILSRKNQVEYQDRSVTQDDAEELANWVRTLDKLVREDVRS